MFRDRWEKLEQENLTSDVQKKLDRMEFDKAYKEQYENLDQTEIDRIVEDEVNNSLPAEGEEALTDNDKHLIGMKSRFVQITRGFFAPDLAAQHRAKMERIEKEKLKSGGGDRAASALGSAKDGSAHDDKSAIGGQAYMTNVPEFWKDKLMEFKTHSVVKFHRLFQSLFYLLKFKERHLICDKGTNKLSWKKAKQHLNDDLFQKMGDYWPVGAKEDNYREYERLKFVQANFEGIAEEAVDEYSVALGKLYRWMNYVIEVRTEDIRQRRAVKKRLRGEREEAIKKEQERVERKQKELEE